MTTIDQILVSRGPGETRVALLATGRLVELHVERAGQESLVGNIYLGRIEAVLPGLDAAFVDLGLDRAGFLALPEVRPAGLEGGNDRIGDYLREGDAVLVQVTRDAAENKGVKLTTHVNLPGVMLVFRPGQPGLTASRRMGEADRARLLAMSDALAREEGGFILRTAAAGADCDAIVKEAEALVVRWRDIEDRKGAMKVPYLMSACPDIAQRMLRDFGVGARQAIVDDAETLARLRAFAVAEMPNLSGRVETYKGAEPLFEALRVEEQIDFALTPTVELPGGGSMIISHTPALTAIDVNTGGADGRSRQETAFAVNMEAAGEIARQLRLRNIAGLIVVDFVPIREEAQKRRVLDNFVWAVADDPLGPQVVGYTRLGLVEMTRRRQGLSLAEILGGTTPDAMVARKSPLTLALEALRVVLREARGRGSAPMLRASPAVIAALEGPAGAAKAEVEAALGVEIRLSPDHTLSRDCWDVVA
jgi:ribonuclease G